MANEPHEDGTAASWLAQKGSPEEWRRAEEEAKAWGVNLREELEKLRALQKALEEGKKKGVDLDCSSFPTSQ